MTHTITLNNGLVITQRDNTDRSAWTPIDRSDELEHAARLADAKVEACEAAHDEIEDWQRNQKATPQSNTLEDVNHG